RARTDKLCTRRTWQKCPNFGPGEFNAWVRSPSRPATSRSIAPRNLILTLTALSIFFSGWMTSSRRGHPGMAALTLTSAALRCFPTHHLNFASDANNTLWTSAGVVGPGVLGWLNREMDEETGGEVRSQGWTPFVLDTNGNGRRDEWVEPNQPLDPTKDKRIAVTTTAWRSVPLTAQSGAACWAIPAVPCGSCPATIQPTLRSPSSTR